MKNEICNICKSGKFAKVLDIDKALSIVRCLGCGVARTYPYPDYEFESQEKYSKFYVDNEAMFRMFARSMMDEVRKYKTGGSFLDVGCSVGYLLDEAKRSGFGLTCGIELNRDAAGITRAKGHTVYTDLLENVNIGRARFDVITFNHVLEHIPDPGHFLVSVREALKDDGLVYTGAPNNNSLMRRWLGRRWYGWGMPDHIWHFELSTFLKIMEQGGFKARRLAQNAMYYPYSKSLRKNTRATVARIAGAAGWGDQVYGIFGK